MEGFFGNVFKKLITSKAGDAFKGVFADDTSQPLDKYQANYSGLKMGVTTDFRTGKAEDIQQTSYDAVKALWDKRHNNYMKSDITVTRS